MRLAVDEEGRRSAAIDESLLDGVDSPGADTMSDDGTIDGNDQHLDPSFYQRNFPLLPGMRPRPRSLHEMPTYRGTSFSGDHVDLPLYADDQFQRFGAWTPNGPVTPEMRTSLGPAHLNLMSSSHAVSGEISYEHRSRSPGMPTVLNSTPSQNPRTRSTSRTPSRRHTLVESSGGYFGQSPLPPQYADSGTAAFDVFEDQRRAYPHPPSLLLPHANPRASSSHLWNLGMRSASDVWQTYLRPEQDYSTFDANHEAIMSTIPGNRSASRHTSRSNSPHPSRVSSRSRLGQLMGVRSYQSHATAPFSYAEAARGAVHPNRSRERSRIEEEQHREAMLRALAEADAAQQLRPDNRRGESERPIEQPSLHPDMMEQVPGTPVTPAEPSDARYIIQGAPLPSPPPQDDNQDVIMTQ